MNTPFHKDASWAPSANSAGLPKFNIGGFKFQTTSSTLSKCSTQTNYFIDILTNPSQCLLDEDGYYFIDRDGELFRPILDFLRTGQMKVPKFIDAKRLIEEAMFYRINVPQILNDVIEPITVAPSPTADFLPLRGGVYVEEPRHDSATIIYVQGTEVVSENKAATRKTTANPQSAYNGLPANTVLCNNKLNMVHLHGEPSIYSFIKSCPVPGVVKTTIELTTKTPKNEKQRVVTKTVTQLYALTINGNLITIRDGSTISTNTPSKDPLAEIIATVDNGSGLLSAKWQHGVNMFEFIILDRMLLVLRTEPNRKMLKIKC